MRNLRQTLILWVFVTTSLAVGRLPAGETVTYPFFGVRHILRTETAPRPLRMYIIEIDLTEPETAFVVTPQSGPRDTTIQTTRQFLVEQDAQIAINVHFFTPYPDDGTGYTWLIGVAASATYNGPHGHAFAPFETGLGYPYVDDLPALNIEADNTAAVVYHAAGDTSGYVTDPWVTLYNAVCGNEQILTAGVNTAGTGSWDNTPHPRTAIGLAPGNRLILFAVDGRQAGISEGMTTGEVANLLHEHYGVTDALNLDGGGSTTLVMADPTPRVVNVPVGVNNVPGSERLVGSNLAVFARACSADTEGVVCGNDGNPCNGEEVCRSGVCVTDTDVTVVHFIPLGGTGSGSFRARDIADNNYSARFYVVDGDPDYAASDYSHAKVTVTFQRSGGLFRGHLQASGLKPNFAYQVKLVGMPEAEFGAAGDDLSNERIGYAGRWYKVGVGNATDAQYQACDADPLCTDIFEGYLIFDFFVTDRLGKASHNFLADESLHVLWRDCPPEHWMTGCRTSGGGTSTVYQDVVALASSGYGYDQNYQTWTIGIWGEIERPAPQGYLPDGEYRCRFVLTEESFHETGIGGQWASAVGATGIHFSINQPAGSRDCEDGNLCNGYESCDTSGICQARPARVCDDQNACTDDFCSSPNGCMNVNNTASCDDGQFCTADDYCANGVCVGGSGDPCTHVCEQCDEDAGACEWCMFDLDGTGVIGGGDFALFSGCYGRCYPAGHACLESNFDGDPNGCVGGGDFGVFSGCYAWTCGQCANCWGPQQNKDCGEQGTAAIAVVVVADPTVEEVRSALPRSMSVFPVGRTFYVEVWASGSWAPNGQEKGLAAVYVDVKYGTSSLVVDEVRSGRALGLLTHGVQEGSAIRGFGGCAGLGEGSLGTADTWVRVGTLQVHGQRAGRVVLETSPASWAYGIVSFERFGNLDRGQVDYGSQSIQIEGPKRRAGRRLAD